MGAGIVIPSDRERQFEDIRCGMWMRFFSLLLAENGYRVTGIDLTENMILEGRQMAAQRGMEVAFLQMDAENLLLPMRRLMRL